MTDHKLTSQAVTPCRVCGAQDRYESGNCRPCTRARAVARYAADPAGGVRRTAEWRKRPGNQDRKNEGERRRRREVWETAGDDYKDELRASWRLWRAANPERVAKTRAARRDKEREYQRTRREECPERELERQRVYYRKNPEKMAAKNAARRARKSLAEGSYAADDVKRIFSAQKGKCACCGHKRKLTVDHIVPLSKGGSNWPSNLQGLCLPCNSAKHARDPIEFMQSKGALL
jgi:5-methylcytosine-specific restriction endonuclease McrA